MKRGAKYVLLACVGLLVHVQFSIMGAARAQALPLGETAVASVLTCGAGDDFYTTFGHTALRITDTAAGIDNVYNYGTFDFDTPHFYWKFMRGQLDYMLGRTTFRRFVRSYRAEGRAVWEQRLLLTPQEVNNLYLMLEWNYEPENRYYRYDLFRDNCATRVRDMVASACGKQEIVYDAWEGHSYRYWLHAATAGGSLEWWIVGVDMLLGLPADHVCDNSESMFYPLSMMTLYAGATRGAAPLVASSQELLQDTRVPLSRSFPPVVVFALFFAVVAVLTWLRKLPRWVDRTLYVMAGVLGCFLLFMWFGTSHYCTAWNLNILWASPLLLLIAIRMERSPLWALWLQEACFAVAAVWVLVCGLSLALLPVIFMLALRVATLLRR